MVRTIRTIASATRSKYAFVIDQENSTILDKGDVADFVVFSHGVECRSRKIVKHSDALICPYARD